MNFNCDYIYCDNNNYKTVISKDGLTVLPANTTLTPAQPGGGGGTPLLSNKSSLTVTPAIGNNLSGLVQPQPAHLRNNKPGTVLRGVNIFFIVIIDIAYFFHCPQ